MKNLILIILMMGASLSATAQLKKAAHFNMEGEYPFYMRSEATYKDGRWSAGNKVQLLNSGLGSLAKRIEMIRAAKERIDIEYFIWELDLSGKVMLTELVKRAREGIKVRIIIDKSITVLELDEYYAQELKRLGVDVRYYNGSYGPVGQQYRTHRKILAIDRKEVITGGRNIGDDYFDLDEVYNFLDRDVWIEGPIASAISDSFDAVWDSEIVQIARKPEPRQVHDMHATAADRRPLLRERVHHRRLKEVKEYFKPDRDLEKRRHDIVAFGNKLLKEGNKPHICPVLTFVSDRPDIGITDVYVEQNRLVHKVLKNRLARVEKRFLMVSPYFMLNDFMDGELGRLLNEGKQVDLYTNSLGSTDAFYVAANFYRIAPEWAARGMNVWMHNSRFYPETEMISPKIESARWGVHSKTHIYDDEDFFVGTYNIDNRSDFFNLEMGVFCEGSPELTKELQANIDQRMQHAYKIIKKEEAVDSKGEPASYWGHASDSHLKIMKAIKLPSRWFEFLM